MQIVLAPYPLQAIAEQKIPIDSVSSEPVGIFFTVSVPNV
jgi:hypothetical protein